MRKKCPHCGDTYGFYTIVKSIDHQSYDWEGAGRDSTTISISEGKVKRCCACSKTVKIPLKEGD